LHCTSLRGNNSSSMFHRARLCAICRPPTVYRTLQSVISSAATRSPNLTRIDCAGAKGTHTLSLVGRTLLFSSAPPTQPLKDFLRAHGAHDGLMLICSIAVDLSCFAKHNCYCNDQLVQLQEKTASSRPWFQAGHISITYLGNAALNNNSEQHGCDARRRGQESDDESPNHQCNISPKSTILNILRQYRQLSSIWK